MKKTISILALAALSLTAITSCNKYENGGSKKKAEENLTGSVWTIDSYYRNGNNETSSLLISNFTENYNSDGSLVRSYTEPDGDAFSETGAWQFDNDKNQINLTAVGSIELTAETSTVSTSDYNILKLTKDELWYTYDNGGDSHEFRMVPQ